jgi:zinc and cadmium transporter
MTAMSVLTWIIAFSVLGSLLSIGTAAAYLLLPETARDRSLSMLVSFATGVLLGVAFIHLLPHALNLDPTGDPSTVMTTVLLGIFTFFFLEKALIWRHAHHHGHDVSHEHRGAKSAGSLILVGDTFHNFLDGILLTAAFVTDIQLGIATGFALIAHEIPQELGDFAILINSGFSRFRALILNALSGLAMVIGALLAWWGIRYVQAVLPYILAFTAAGFIYIAVADLIPTLHRGVRLRDTLTQLTLISAGILLIVAFQHSEAG